MKKLIPYIALFLLLAELALILVSWLLSAALPNSGVRSMLSGEGIRWFLGHYGTILATPILSWLILAAIAVGCLRSCGVFSHSSPYTYRERRAMLIGGGTLLTCGVAVLLLTVVPHAVLVSATGGLFPSPFSYSLIPVISFSLCAFSIVYGLIAGTFQSLRDVYDSLLCGIRWAAPCVLFYILLIQFYESLRFVFG
ncbi:MAG: AbgT family transporter [Prevotella sp.]|nr:AbgT family transporter [Prevotella sp.]